MVELREILAAVLVALLKAEDVGGSLTWEGDGQKGIVDLSWSQWVGHLVSRSVYIVLILLITICIAVTSFKNKYGGTESDDSETILGVGDGTSWLDTLRKAAAGGSSPVLLTSATGGNNTFRNLMYGQSDEHESEVETRLKEKLRDAEAAVGILRQELDKSNEARVELENTLEALDKDKDSVEDNLMHQKFQGALELEHLKREIDSTRRKLQKALVERDELSKEVGSLQRDARIVSSALRDNQLMDIRLEEARKEIEELKRQLDGIQREKEIAARVVEEIVSKKPSGYQLPSILNKITSSIAQEDDDCTFECSTPDEEDDGNTGSELTLQASSQEMQDMSQMYDN